MAIASWALSSTMETFVRPRVHTTAVMHFIVKAVLSSNFNSIWVMDNEEIGNIQKSFIGSNKFANL